MTRVLPLRISSLPVVLSLAIVVPSLGGPNLVAVGSFDLPYKEASMREGINEKQIIFEFDGEHDFGRVVLETTTPHSVVRTNEEDGMNVRFNTRFLEINFGNGGMENRKCTVWFRVDGKLRPGKTYEYVVSTFLLEQDNDLPIPITVPGFWADGKFVGVQTVINDPVLGEQAAERIQREIYQRGKIKLPDFQRQTGGAWVVLDIPPDVSRGMGIAWMSFREIDEDLLAGKEPEMPVPVRYIPLDASIIGQSSAVFEYSPIALRNIQNQENGSWGQGDANAVARQTALTTLALQETPREPDPNDPDENRRRLYEEEQLTRARDFLAGLSLDAEDDEGGNQGSPPPSQPRSPPSGGSGRGGRGGARGSGGGGRPTGGGGGGGGGLQSGDLSETSAVAARLMCLSRAPDPAKYRQVINADVEWLTRAQMDDGGWAERSPEYEGDQAHLLRSDNANTESALAGLREAFFAGVSTDRQVWIQAAKYASDAQAVDGGFREKLDQYGGLGQATNVERTAAGIANMLTILDIGYGATSSSCSGYLANKGLIEDVERGLAWMNENFGEYYQDAGTIQDVGQLNPEAGVNPFNVFAALSDLHRASGLTHYHEKDWIIEQGQKLIRWFNPGTALFNNDPLLTAYGLLNLREAAAPTVIQRITLGGSTATETSPDANHLARYLMSSREIQLNWLRATLETPVRDMLRVPMMLLKVMGPFEAEKENWQRLREYVMGGGVIFVDVDGDQANQRASIESKFKEILPEYEWRELVATDPVLKSPNAITPGKMKVLSNGFRNLVYLPEESWVCAWQQYDLKKEAAKFQFVENLLTATTGGEKLRGWFEPPTYEIGAKPDREVRVALVETGSGARAYPDALGALDRLMQANYRVKVLDGDAKSDTPAELMWLSMTGKAPMKPDVQKNVLDHVNRGGFLLADVASGNKNWAEQLQADLRKMDSKLTLKRLRQSDPIYTGEIPGTQGFDVRRADFRQALRTKFIDRGRCDMFALMRGQEMVGVLSNYDLISGLGYHMFPDCRGLMPDDSRRMAMNTLLFSMSRKAGATQVASRP